MKHSEGSLDPQQKNSEHFVDSILVWPKVKKNVTDEGRLSRNSKAHTRTSPSLNQIYQLIQSKIKVSLE